MSEGRPLLPLEDVFKTVGIPTHTFVEPLDYNRLLVSIRTPGKPVIVEGPSGIGKTTSVIRALSDLGYNKKMQLLKARSADDVGLITMLPEVVDPGVIMIDDFHVLPDRVKKNIADYIKLITDEERPNTKIIILGINLAGQTLLEFASDLSGRLERFQMEVNPEEKLLELLRKGESALNITINNKSEIARESLGSFQLCQMIAYESCMSQGIMEAQHESVEVRTPIGKIRERILDNISVSFFRPAYVFARGLKFRPSGRGPYLRLLRWLSESEEWSLDVRKAINDHTDDRPSVGQIIDKGFVTDFVKQESKILANFIHYDPISKRLTIEDPKAFYYLKHLNWNRFASRCGFERTEFERRYDVALSFAGSDRNIAEAISGALEEEGLHVFYDKNEQADMLGQDLEEYLKPIYASDSEFVVVILGKDYPERVWTRFESEQFEARFGEGRVIPVLVRGVTLSFFDAAKKVAGLSFEIDRDAGEQARAIAEVVSRKLALL